MAGTEALTANGAGAGPASNGPASGTATASTANNNTEVWSNLLKTVASSRLVPTKDVIILGDPHSGKSTLIELLKTALPTPTPDALANGADGSKTANGVPSGPNGVATAANSAPIMVEMGTSTSEDGIVDGQKKNDLALSYSFWDVEDDENEDTVARLGLYQIAGSHKSYHALLKYCLNTKTIADTVVLIVLDWSKPWTFVETLERWVKVLDTAIKQILQEGAVATAAWTKGKAVMEELQEKLSRFLQEYTEPQPHGTSTFSELGSTDAQSVLLPLTEGCLTNNTGIPIAIVCTKSDNINILEREMDYKEESFDYIQQTLRTICLKYGASLFYTSIHHPHTFADLRQYILHRLLTPSTLNNAQQQQQQQQQPSSFPFKLRAQVVERDQVMVPSGWDSIGKIKVLRSGFDCEGVAAGWDDDLREGAPAEGVPETTGARKVYEETIRNPRLTHAPVTIQPIIVTEDDQTFLDRHFDTLQKANERPSLSNSGHGSQPPVVGPLGSGYTSMLNVHHGSPPPSGSAGQAMGAGSEAENVQDRLMRLTSKGKLNGSSAGMIPSSADGGMPPAMNFMRPAGTPPMGGAGGMLPGGAGRPGEAPAAGGTESAAISQFFQSLMSRGGGAGRPAGAPGVPPARAPSSGALGAAPGSGGEGQ